MARNRIYKLNTGHRGKIKGIQCQIKACFYDKSCEVCGETITRKVYESGRYETWARFFIRKTCSKKCKKLLISKDGNPNYKGIMPRCNLCKKILTVYPSKKAKGRFCRECFNKLRTGCKKFIFSDLLDSLSPYQVIK